MPEGGFELKLTEEQTALLAKANDAEKLRQAYEKISREIAKQQLDDMGLVNEWDASGRRTRSDALPEDPEVAIRFPGVDPRGKYGPLDMKLAQRVETVRATLAARSPETAEFVTQTIFDGDGYRALERQVDELARQQRIDARAQKICDALAHSGVPAPIPGDARDERRVADNKQGAMVVAKHNLKAAMQDRRNHQAVIDLQRAIEGAECLVGVRSGPLPESIVTFYRDTLGVALTPERVAAGREPVVPTRLNVAYPSFRNKEVQLQLSKPENWGKRPQDFSPLSRDEINAQIAPYLRATTGRTLDALFSPAEQMGELDITSSKACACVMDRGDHIIIGSRTVNERLMEEYQLGRQSEFAKYQSFQAFLQAEGHRRATELVAAGLTAGERVELFIPDKRGRIPDEPVRMTQTGFEPERFDPVTLNCWERFWNRFGFYKEKAAQAQADASVLAARERVKLYHQSTEAEFDSFSSGRATDMFFGGWMKEHGVDELPVGSVRDYSLARTAWSTLATLKMLADGHPLADVFDPDKLRDEKQAVGKLLVDKIGAKDEHGDPILGTTGLHPTQPDDPNFEAELFFKGAAALIEQADRMAGALDLKDPNALFSDAARPLRQAMGMVYDAYQEMVRFRQSGQAATDALGRLCAKENCTPAEFEAREDMLAEFGKVYNALHQGMVARRDIVSGVCAAPEESPWARMMFTNYVVGMSMAEEISSLKGRDGAMPLSGLIKKYSLALEAHVGTLVMEPSEAVAKAVDRYASPSTQGQMRRGAFTGSLAREEIGTMDRVSVLKEADPNYADPKPQKATPQKKSAPQKAL